MDPTLTAFFTRRDTRQVTAALQLPITLSAVDGVSPRKGIRVYGVAIGSAPVSRYVAVAGRVHTFPTVEALRAAVAA